MLLRTVKTADYGLEVAIITFLHTPKVKVLNGSKFFAIVWNIPLYLYFASVSVCVGCRHGPWRIKIYIFLADYTAIRCLIGYWHDTVVCASVCLSVTKCFVVKRYTLQQSVYKQVNWKYPQGCSKTIIQRLTPYTDPIPSNYQPFVPWASCYLLNKLKLRMSALPKFPRLG